MLIRTDTLQPWAGEALNDIRYPANIEDLWSNAELAAIGLARPEPFVLPPGKITNGPPSYVAGANGVEEVRPVIDDPGPDLDTVKEECRRRIFDACPATAQSNMLGYINLLNVRAISGTQPTADQQADLTLFVLAMAWINAMRSACPALVDNLAYRDDANWPPLSPDLAAFAARF